jgi:hypothetical protein
MSGLSRLSKNFLRALKAHLDGLTETTPIEVWFEMLCSRGPARLV